MKRQSKLLDNKDAIRRHWKFPALCYTNDRERDDDEEELDDNTPISDTQNSQYPNSPDNSQNIDMQAFLQTPTSAVEVKFCGGLILNNCMGKVNNTYTECDDCEESFCEGCIEQLINREDEMYCSKCQGNYCLACGWRQCSCCDEKHCAHCTEMKTCSLCKGVTCVTIICCSCVTEVCIRCYYECYFCNAPICNKCTDKCDACDIKSCADHLDDVVMGQTPSEARIDHACTLCVNALPKCSVCGCTCDSYSKDDETTKRCTICDQEMCAYHSTCWCEKNVRYIPSFGDCTIKFS